MRALSVFLQISLDGCVADGNGDLSWARHDDEEFRAFVAENAEGGGALLFGRVTYDLMMRYWPTPLAAQNDPALARQMNALPKYVVSRRMTAASWSNTTLIKGDLVAAIRRLKSEAGPGLTILGSGSLVAQLAEAELIDELQLVVNPVALGAGRRLFDGLAAPRSWTRAGSRAFANGCVALRYAPKRQGQ